MNRRDFLRTTVLGSAATLAGPAVAKVLEPPARVPRIKAFELDEMTVAQLQGAMKSGKFTAASLTKKYLSRIHEVDAQGPKRRAVIELNPDAFAIAAALDRERASKGPRGPLHGIPVLIKDNLDTHDRMSTTAGSLALAGSIPHQDSFVAQKLREAGAVILGKTNLSEWANFRGSRSTSGWSGRGGLTRNPYVLDRNPSGSSSGSAAAVSANLCAVAIGTETDGSIVSPSSLCGIVGLKPTVGLWSRNGVVPISSTQDTPGPLGRTVRDAAILLGALVGVDDRDAATEASRDQAHRDYTQFLDAEGLKGARIGVVRKMFKLTAKADRVMDKALETMKQRGAILVDPADIPTLGKFGESEYDLMLYEFKAGLNAYLAGLSSSVAV